MIIHSHFIEYMEDAILLVVLIMQGIRLHRMGKHHEP